MLAALLLLAAPDFEIEYESYVPPKYEAIVFLAADCPVAQKYAGRLSELADRYPQFHFQGIITHSNTPEAKVTGLQRALRFGLRRDASIADRLGATRSPEAFLLVNGAIVYHGRIDDQYSPGTDRGQPTRRDLEEAICETLAGQIVSVPVTEASGCVLEQSAAAGHEGEKVTFDKVASIFHQRYAECHRDGQAAPFPLLKYEDAETHQATIRDVILSGRMPPWHADPNFGTFANDRSLTADEKLLLMAWIGGGAARGTNETPMPQFNDDWAIRPDVVLQMPRPFAVPAEGILDYQEFALDPCLQEDQWIQAVEVRPGNRTVVHHVNVLLRPPGADYGTVYYNSMRDLYFMTMLPGNGATRWPPGTAKLIPAGWELVLSIHYQPSGQTEEDQTSIALEFANPASVRQQMATRAILKEDILLPPNTVTTLANEWMLEDDFTLYALMPHMHLRGRSMRVEANGQTLLFVPHFDFNWQHRYVLAEPLRLKRGTVIHCTAEYDNTAANPNNPDPTATVATGLQSTDEMFQLNLDVTRTSENRIARSFRTPWVTWAVLACVLVFMFAHSASRR